MESKRLKPQDIIDLSVGDKVTFINRDRVKNATYIGVNPNNKCYHMFCHEIDVIQVYFRHPKAFITENIYKGLTAKEEGQILIDYYEHMIKIIKDIYS